ncbi:MAG: TlpA disulfide reductase family protein [Steroidobacteraceae bacterium]|jgi:peroxiredoxin
MDDSPRFGASLRFGGILVLATMMAMSSSAAAPPSLVGQDAPDFVLKAQDGKNLRLSEFRGQVVLVNFWARWAGDSRKEMPALDRINKTYERAGLVVLGVSVDDDVRRASEFASSMGVSFPILFDMDGTTGRDYMIRKMPITFLVDRAGVVRYTNIGFKRGDENAYLDEIRELLRE